MADVSTLAEQIKEKEHEMAALKKGEELRKQGWDNMPKADPAAVIRLAMEIDKLRAKKAEEDADRYDYY